MTVQTEMMDLALQVAHKHLREAAGELVHAKSRLEGLLREKQMLTDKLQRSQQLQLQLSGTLLHEQQRYAQGIAAWLGSQDEVIDYARGRLEDCIKEYNAKRTKYNIYEQIVENQKLALQKRAQQQEVEVLQDSVGQGKLPQYYITRVIPS